MYIKNPQFSCNHADILPKLPIYKLVILTKYHNDRVKIVDFFIKPIFEPVLFFIIHTLSTIPLPNLQHTIYSGKEGTKFTLSIETEFKDLTKHSFKVSNSRVSNFCFPKSSSAN